MSCWQSYPLELSRVLTAAPLVKKGNDDDYRCGLDILRMRADEEVYSMGRSAGFVWCCIGTISSKRIQIFLFNSGQQVSQRERAMERHQTVHTS